MRIVFDYNCVLDKAVGIEQGIALKEINSFKVQTREIHQDLVKRRKAGEFPFRDLPYQKEMVKEVLQYAQQFYRKFENFVVVGIGGSALGNLAMHNALNPLFYNERSLAKRAGRPRIYVPDNSDPDLIGDLLEVIDPKKTLFNVITKSGDTAETMSAFMIFRDLLIKKVGKKYAQHLVFTTDKEKGTLRQLAQKEGIRTFEVPAGVGGRFSVLSPVGLLSAAIEGIDIEQVLQGAAEMDKICSSDELLKNPAYLNAVIHYLMDSRKKKNISVMMAYSNRLYYLADWYRQLWAESLGKKMSKEGLAVNVGQTPIKALGATDQHSQIQLYVEGPNDKILTFLTVGKYSEQIQIPKVYQDSETLSYLAGKKLQDLIQAEQMGTQYALQQAGRPSVSIHFPAIHPSTIGQFFYLYEVQTIFAGYLYGINALDQPGVEAGKVATYALMGRKGYEQQRVKIQEGLKKDREYIL